MNVKLTFVARDQRVGIEEPTACLVTGARNAEGERGTV
jgi:hypothetical protein